MKLLLMKREKIETDEELIEKCLKIDEMVQQNTECEIERKNTFMNKEKNSL